MYVCNKEIYGYFPVPMPSHATLNDEGESFLHTQLEVMGESKVSQETDYMTVLTREAVYHNRFLEMFPKAPSELDFFFLLGFDSVVFRIRFFYLFFLQCYFYRVKI